MRAPRLQFGLLCLVGVSASAVLDLPAGSLTSGAGLARGMCHVSRRTGIPP